MLAGLGILAGECWAFVVAVVVYGFASSYSSSSMVVAIGVCFSVLVLDACGLACEPV
jgi:hypothetical protein